MFEMREVIYNDQQYTVSYSDQRAENTRWVVTSGWQTITGELKKQVKKEFLKELGVVKIQDYNPCKPVSLDCCTTASVPCAPYNCCAPNKKEDNMRNELVINAISAPTAQTMDQEKTNYLLGRLSSIYCAKDNALRKTYGLYDDASPATPKEFIKRIQDGKFVLTKRAENFEDDDYFDYFDGIGRYLTWRDPAVKEDKAGFKAAEALMDAAYAKTKDTIQIGTAKEGLDAVYAFEAQTFSVN